MFLYLGSIWALGLGSIWALFGLYLGSRLGYIGWGLNRDLFEAWVKAK